jgi:hypothetical protein
MVLNPKDKLQPCSQFLNYNVTLVNSVTYYGKGLITALKVFIV